MATVDFDRDIVVCPWCECVQYRPRIGGCRRCKCALRAGSVASTTVIVIERGETLAARAVRRMRDVMQSAAVQAVEELGGTMLAAKALEIPHSRVKQLLRESGDVQDYRKGKKARRQGRCEK